MHPQTFDCREMPTRETDPADQDAAFIACSMDDHLARLELATMACTQRVGLT